MKSQSRLRARLFGRSMLVAAALALPAAAWAQVGYTMQAVNMRAGPDREYPQVAWIPSGVSVNVIGCIDGYRWCDVVAGPNRGWVYARFISYPYQNQPVPIITGGAILGLPLITFSIGPYWDNYYRGRPWYGNRSYWYSRPAPPPYYRPPPPRYQPPPPRPPTYIPPSSRPPGYVPPPGGRPPGGRPPSGNPPPNTGQPPGGRPPNTGQPPGNPPPSGGRPPGGGAAGLHPQPPVSAGTPQK
jgi:uncharacterized protein YraI